MKFTFQLGRQAVIKWSYNKYKNSNTWDKGKKLQVSQDLISNGYNFIRMLSLGIYLNYFFKKLKLMKTKTNVNLTNTFSLYCNGYFSFSAQHFFLFLMVTKPTAALRNGDVIQKRTIWILLQDLLLGRLSPCWSQRGGDVSLRCCFPCSFLFSPQVLHWHL